MVSSVRFGGTIAAFSVQGLPETDANGINDSGYVVGEYYINDTFEGYLRAPDGTITFGIVPPGSIETFPYLGSTT